MINTLYSRQDIDSMKWEAALWLAQEGWRDLLIRLLRDSLLSVPLSVRCAIAEQLEPNKRKITWKRARRKTTSQSVQEKYYLTKETFDELCKYWRSTKPIKSKKKIREELSRLLHISDSTIRRLTEGRNKNAHK